MNVACKALIGLWSRSLPAPPRPGGPSKRPAQSHSYCRAANSPQRRYTARTMSPVCPDTPGAIFLVSELRCNIPIAPVFLSGILVSGTAFPALQFMRLIVGKIVDQV
jgi:hypothetical protein